MFIRLIKMVFAPVIFATVVLGIARMENMKELGRVGVRALIYFEVLSTFALAHVGPRGKPVVDFLESFTHGIFSVVGMVMRLAPLAAFGAMAFTVGKYGLLSLIHI